MGNNQNSKVIHDGGRHLSRNEIESIKTSWHQLVKIGLDDLGVGLMTRILIEHKDLKSIWRKQSNATSTVIDDQLVNPNQAIKQHGEKVFETIKMVINSLDNLESLNQHLDKIGYEHYKYGTRFQHYDIMGEALISTLSDALRDTWNESTKKSWLKLFAIIELQMRTGMLRAEAE